MIKIFLFCIITYSLTSIIVEQRIFEEVRNALMRCAESNSFFIRKICQLIKCTFCTGFWAGVLITLSGFDIFEVGPIGIFYGGLFGAVSSYTISLLVGLLMKTAEKMGLDV